MPTLFKPMKAFYWTPKFDKYPCLIQRKYNGIRAAWYGNYFVSNDEKVWHPSKIPHLYEYMMTHHFGDRLDGEFYCHGMSLQEINSRVAINSTEPHSDILAIKYVVFDVIERKPMSQRLDKLIEYAGNLVSPSCPIEIAPTYYCSSWDFLAMSHREFVKEGYEGTMIRTLDDEYGFIDFCGNKQNRWNCLLKRKDVEVEVCTILKVNEGEGKYVNSMGSLTCATPDGVEFKCGTGFGDAVRKWFWENQHLFNGTNRKCEIRFFDLSDEERPTQARFSKLL